MFAQSAAINSCLIKAGSDQLETPSHILFIVRRARRIPSGWRIKMDVKNSRFSVATVLSFPQVLRNDEQLLHTVLNNMSQGVLLFDSELRLVICNQRYIEMYGLSPENVKPGCTLLDLLDSRARAGTFSGNPADYVASLVECIAEGKTFTNTTKLSDGRVIAL